MLSLFREFFSYTPSTGVLRWTEKMKHRAGKTAGSIFTDGYKYVFLNGKLYRSHVICWSLYYGRLPDKLVDHKNCNKIDNRIKNLRLATHSESCFNRRMHKTNTTGFKGVSPYRGKFRAVIYLNYKQIYLGLFDTPQIAHGVYKKAAKKFHGAFARS